MASLSLVDSGSDYLTLQVVDLDTSYDNDDRTVFWYYRKNTDSDMIYSGADTIGASVSQSGTHTISGLEADTSYYIEAVIYYSDGSDEMQSVTVSYFYSTDVAGVYDIVVAPNNAEYGTA